MGSLRQRLMLFYLMLNALMISCQQKDIPVFCEKIKITSVNKLPTYPGARITDLVSNSKGEMFLCDNSGHRILVLSNDGEFIREIGDYSDNFGIMAPLSLAIDNSENLVVMSEKQVYILTPTGELLRSFTINFTPNSAVTDLENNIFIVGYSERGIIHKFSSNGKLLRTFGDTYPHENARIRRNYSGGSLSISQDRLYYASKTPYIISVFDLNGNLKRTFARQELDFNPQFEIIGERYSFSSYSHNLKICIINGKILNSYYISGQGMFIDIFDDSGFVFKNIPTEWNLKGANPLGQIILTKSGSNIEEILTAKFSYNVRKLGDYVY